MIDRNTLIHEAGAALLRVAPPVGIAAGTAFGAINPQWFIAIPTAIYVTAQLSYLIWKWRRESRSK